MKKTRTSRVRPKAAAAWKSCFAGEEVKSRKEGKKRWREPASPAVLFSLLRVSAAGVRRPAWGLHLIARPPPCPCFRG